MTSYPEPFPIGSLVPSNRDKLKNFFGSMDPAISGAQPHRLLVISPYISRDALEDVISPLLERCSPEVHVICSWRTADLVSGASDIGVYELCRDNGWKLSVDHDQVPRRIHLKAYLGYLLQLGVTVRMGMIGSANLTNSGLDSNVEYLHHLTHRDLPGHLDDEVEKAMSWARGVDDEAYESMKEHLEAIGTRESEDIPDWIPPEQDRYTGRNSLELSIINRMPVRHKIMQKLVGTLSLEDAIEARGLRFSQVRRVVSEKNPEVSRDEINDLTNETMLRLVEGDSRLDLQRGPQGHHSLCLVWRLQSILNEAIGEQLRGHVGKTMKELGLDKSLCDESLRGSRSQHIRRVCLGLLDDELRKVVRRMSTWDATIAINWNFQPKENRPVGPSILSDSLPAHGTRPELLDSLWLPSFCIYQTEAGATLGDVVLQGLRFWEPTYKDVENITRDYLEDIDLISRNDEALRNGDSTFLPKENDRERIFAKVRTGKGRGHQPLASKQRPLCHYLNKTTLAFVVHGH